MRSYTFSYDKASRLLSGTYAGLDNENFSLPSISYDKNGNILNLQRKGKNGGSFGDIDNLTYNYSGNKLNFVNDAVTSNEDVGDFRNNNTGTNDYEYWNDGSLKVDRNKGISQIDYDSYLKKVSQINFSNGNWVKFFYNGSGTLLTRSNSLGDAWDYVANMIYKNGLPYQMSTPEGRAVFVEGVWVYEFEYRDIWNNLRVSFKADGSNLELVQKADYDAFGLELNPLSSTGVPPNNFKFQGQERISDFNIGVDLFKYRPSDYQIGRFWQIDPLADKYAYNSPFALQENKFGLGVELEGMELQEFANWVEKKIIDFKKSIPNIKLESTVSIGPQVGFEIQAPYVSAQAELKLASVEVAKYSAETRNGNVNTSNLLGYTQKTKEGNNPEKTTELNGSNVENSVGFGVGIGPLSVGKETGQKQVI